MSSQSAATKRRPPALAAILALVVTAATSLFAAGSDSARAWAETVPDMPDTATLTINKYDGTGSTPATGGVMTPPEGANPLEGIKFNLYAVNGIDLTTQDGWAAASGVALSDLFTDEAARTVDASKVTKIGDTLTTTSTGSVTSPALTPRLYLVVEQTNQTTKDGKTVVPTQPFLVTVPMTDPNGQGWLTDVKVFPKNRTVDATTLSLNPTKAILDPLPTGTGVDLTGSSKGEDIRYVLTAAAPTVSADNNYDGFVVADKLPAGISTTSDSVVVKLDGQPAGTQLYDTSVSTVDGRSVVLVKFKPETTVPSNLGGKTITVEITGTVDAVTTGSSGVKENTGYFYPGYLDTSAKDWDPTTASGMLASGSVRSIYGQIVITKQDAKDLTGLPGAEFSLYRCDADGIAVGNPIRIAGTTTFTTDARGSTTIEGIHLGNVNTEGVYTDLWADSGTRFCLVESSAPAGYQKLLKPIPVNELAGAVGTTGTVETQAVIKNVKSLTLPLTGGIGLWLILGTGAAMIIGSLVYRSRKNA